MVASCGVGRGFKAGRAAAGAAGAGPPWVGALLGSHLLHRVEPVLQLLLAHQGDGLPRLHWEDEDLLEGPAAVYVGLHPACVAHWPARALPADLAEGLLAPPSAFAGSITVY